MMVRRGVHVPTGQRVVVKLPNSSAPRLRTIARLQHEHAMLAYLADVPDVVRAVAHDSAALGAALVLEDQGRETLANVLATRRFSVVEALRVAIEIARVLAAVHARGVLHKDMKPENLLVSSTLEGITLIDFGCATWLSHELQQVVAPEEIVGTLAYIAPEQTGQMNRVTDQRSDLYSLGVVLYEMLVGALPFESDDALALIHSHLARTPTPPHERAAGVPIMLSRVVMKLLAKEAEERYQSATGLQADLEECALQLASRGTIGTFPLGVRDRSGVLRLSQKLYGREEAIATLLGVFERVRLGAPELLLVTGAAGVGKTAVVSEIHRALALQDGFFITGKFDQLHRNTPLGPLSEAFRGLIRRLLAGPSAALARWKERLGRALGASGKLVTDLIPELELILGPQLAPPRADATVAQSRFVMVMQRFVRALSTRERPLVIFLDDLQWADTASLRLLHAMLTDKEGAALLIVGAYRSDEVDREHPLSLMREALRKDDGRCEEIELPLLSRTLVHQWLGDALEVDLEAVAALGDQVFDKTHGSPFFVTQLVNALHESKLLWFDQARWTWAWDLAAIAEASVADNVVSFMIGRLQQMSPAGQAALSLAACIGHRFDLTTLSTVAERPTRALAADLWEALHAGLIVPLDADYRFFHAPQGIEAAEALAGASGSYRFLHDRVQQAAYALIGESEREGVHLRIGRLLSKALGGERTNAELFNVVHHLNLGAQRLLTPDERLALAQLNLTAGRIAKATTAYSAAVGYLAAGITALGEAGWERAHELRYALELTLARSVHLTGQLEEAGARFERLMPYARSKADFAELYSQRITLCMSRGEFAAGTALSREALALFGVALPTTPEEIATAFAEGIADVDRLMAGRTMDDLVNAPLLMDPDLRLVSRLFMASTYATLTGNPSLGHVIILKQLRLCLEHGLTEISAHSYSWAGVVMNIRLGRYRDALQLGRVALALLERFETSPVAGQVNMVFAMCIGHYCEPIPDLIQYLEVGIDAGLRLGDFAGAATNAVNIAYLLFSRGEDLDAVEAAVERAFALVRRTREAYAEMRLTVLRQAVASLQGNTRELGGMNDGAFDETAWDEHITRSKMPRVNTSALRLVIRFFAGDHEGAQLAAESAEKVIWETSGSTLATEVPFYAALTICARFGDLSAAAQAQALKDLARHQASHAVWAEHCAVNYGHRRALLDAEVARVSGHGMLALDEYERAIALAQRHGCSPVEALAHELCARFHLSAGRFRAARSSMREAHEVYARWGATGKVRKLEARYPELLSEGGPEKVSVAALLSSRPPKKTSRATTGHVSEILDAATILSAAQTVTSELVLEKMLEGMMRVVLETALAQRGLLLLPRDGQLTVAASRTVDASGPSPDNLDFAASIVEYVQRTRCPVVVRDGLMDGRFNADPYIQENRPRSILCLAMVHRNHLAAILYLENNLVAAAFTPNRLDLLGLFSSHAVVALENVRLFAEVTAVSAKLEHANTNLALEVEAQTDELRQANSRLLLDLEERSRNEEAREALQQEIIQMQAERLQELSTPLIPITDRIMVMPLIGTINVARASDVLAEALRAASQARAAVVILDITGVGRVDAEVASILVRTAETLKLLGTHTVLTGVSPAFALTLVGLAFEKKTMAICGTLQDGIAYALGRTGELMTAAGRRGL
jgi:predicted ATPase/GAF domain-containing protein